MGARADSGCPLLLASFVRCFHPLSLALVRLLSGLYCPLAVAMKPGSTQVLSPAAGGGGTVLMNQGSGLCLDPLATAAPSLTDCAKPGLGWSYLPASGQFQSTASEPCRAPASKGKNCHVCLDLSGPVRPPQLQSQLTQLTQAGVLIGAGRPPS